MLYFFYDNNEFNNNYFFHYFLNLRGVIYKETHKEHYIFLKLIRQFREKI